jgi:hypothetical protein
MATQLQLQKQNWLKLQKGSLGCRQLHLSGNGHRFSMLDLKWQVCIFEENRMASMAIMLEIKRLESHSVWDSDLLAQLACLLHG